MQISAVGHVLDTDILVDVLLTLAKEAHVGGGRKRLEEFRVLEASLPFFALAVHQFIGSLHVHFVNLCGFGAVSRSLGLSSALDGVAEMSLGLAPCIHAVNRAFRFELHRLL